MRRCRFLLVSVGKLNGLVCHTLPVRYRLKFKSGQSAVPLIILNQGLKLEEATCLELKNPSNLNPRTMSFLFIDD